MVYPILINIFACHQDNDDPLSHIHFTAEGEVTFKSILFIPTSAPRGLFDEYGSKKNDYIKVSHLNNIWDEFKGTGCPEVALILKFCFPAVRQKSVHHR